MIQYQIPKGGGQMCDVNPKGCVGHYQIRKGGRRMGHEVSIDILKGEMQMYDRL